MTPRSSHPEVFCKEGVLKNLQNLQENTYSRVTFLIKLQVSACDFIKKETLAQVFSCEFCEISRTRAPPGDCFWIPKVYVFLPGPVAKNQEY